MEHMQGKTGIAISIALTILALFIGLFGIAILIGVGEAANNTITAFAAVSFPFALLAGFLSWITPQARWAIAGAMSAPVALISIAGSWSSAFLMPGAIWTVALTCVGAYLGGRLRLSRSKTQGTPPS
jgi:hypothetical protein